MSLSDDGQMAAGMAAPTTWAEALEVRAERAELVPTAGGTDVMVDVNFDRLHPPGLLDLTAVEKVDSWTVEEGFVVIGAGMTYARVLRELGALVPALATAARTVGSPQIRNRGTVAGNLGSASPAGDCHPPLLAAGALVELESVRGRRVIPVRDLFAGGRRTTMEPDELIRAVRVPVADDAQQFSKVGTRNAMVIAVTSFAIALHTPEFRERVCVEQRALDHDVVPPMHVELLEHPDPHAPYGLRGMAEAPTISATPAIVAAIRDATGLELARVPVRPEHIATPTRRRSAWG